MPKRLKKYIYFAKNWMVILWTELLARTYHKWMFRAYLADWWSENYWDSTTLPYPVPWSVLTTYKDLYVEIGTGHGETITHLAAENRQNLIVSFEKSRKFARLAAKKVIQSAQAKVIHGDAYTLIPHLFKKHSISKVFILFPDPWHKARHAKRRPLTEQFFTKLSPLLVPDAEILIATDWPEYYEFIFEELKQVPKNMYEVSKGRNYKPEKFGLVPTHYYLKWKKQKRMFYWIKILKK